MKMFDYVCGCGFIFTFLQTDYEKKHSPKKCPRCEKVNPIRMIPRIHTKSFYGPNHPRHRRGMGRVKLPEKYPLYAKEDL